MIDVTHYIGDDLQVSSTGDLALADTTTSGQQKVLRRLLTGLTDYIWHQDYGSGLPTVVGSTMDANAIKALIQASLALESDVVLADPPAAIIITPITNGVAIQIMYVDADTGLTVPLAFDVTQ